MKEREMSIRNTVPQELLTRYEELVESYGGAGYLQLGGVDYLFRRPTEDEMLSIGRDVIDVSPETVDRSRRVMVYRKLLLTLVDEEQRRDMLGFVNERLEGEAKIRREEAIVAGADHFIGWLGGDAVITPMPSDRGLTVYVDQEFELSFRLPSMEEINRSAKHYQVGRVYRGLRELVNACAGERKELEKVVRTAGPLCLTTLYKALIDGYEDAHGSTEVRSAGF
jgi:hypothetical protein